MIQSLATFGQLNMLAQWNERRDFMATVLVFHGNATRSNKKLGASLETQSFAFT